MQCADDYGFPYDDMESCVRLERVHARASAEAQSRVDCSDALAALDCEALIMGQWPEACASVIAEASNRAVPEGELCRSGSWCEEGFTCVWEAEDCGRCQKQRAAGEACRANADCQSLWCGEEGRCKALAGEGAVCASHEGCDSALQCVGGACRSAPREGDACTRGERCAAGSYCNLGTCVPATLPKLGDACEADAYGCYALIDTVWWGAGLICQDGVCSEAPGDGEACSDLCREGYICLDGTCASTEGGGEGDACSVGTCNAGLICSLDVCTRLAAVGEPWLGPSWANGGCTPDAYPEGYPGFTFQYEDKYLCAERLPDGSACGADNECLGGLCTTEGTCAHSACRADD